jgi:predicted RNase H-like HicB family nuclease
MTLSERFAQAVAALSREPYAWVFVPKSAGGFSASIFELPGCVAQGESLEEAHSNLTAVAILWLETALRQQIPVPPPLQRADLVALHRAHDALISRTTACPECELLIERFRAVLHALSIGLAEQGADSPAPEEKGEQS